MKTIGSLTQKLTPLAESSDSHPPKSSQNSAPAARSLTISRATNAIDRSAQGGTSAPANGSLVVQKTSLADAMQASAPDQTKQIVAALMPPGVRSSLKPVFSPAGEITNYALSGSHGAREIQEATAILDQSLTPISGLEALDLLSELKSLTRPQAGQTTTDMADQMTAYLKRLVKYPADVARHVLTTQPDQSVWWPAWQEIQERLEIHTYRRRMMLAAMKSVRCPTGCAATPTPPKSSAAAGFVDVPFKPEPELTAEQATAQLEKDRDDFKRKYGTILDAG